MKCLRFLFLSVAVFAAQVLAAQPIRMGYFMLPPHQYPNNDAARPKGASIAYFEALAAKMGYAVEWVGPLPLLRLSESLKKGEVDGAIGVNKFPEMELFLYYPGRPMYLAYPTFMVRKDNPLKQIRSIEDIRGYRIGLTESIAGRYIPLIDEHRDAITLEQLGGENWIEQNIQKLVAGRLDAFFDRQPYSMLFIAARLGLDARVKVLPAPDPPTPMYVVFSQASKRGQMLLERCNAVLPQLGLNYDDLAQNELDAAAERK